MTNSATFGAPPNTRDDYYVARYMLRVLFHAPPPPLGPDPKNGLPGFAMFKPPPAHNPTTRKQVANLTGYILIAVLIALITVGRVVVKVRGKGRRWEGEDWAVLAAAASAFTHCVLECLNATKANMGRHIWDITYANMRFLSENMPFILGTFFLSSGLLKISLTLLLRRAFAHSMPAWHLATNLFLGLLVVYTLAAPTLFLCMCGNPRSAIDIVWAAQQPLPKCLDGWSVNIATCVCHVALDFCLMVAAGVLFGGMNMSVKKKVWVAVLFSAGVCSLVFSIVRTWVENRRAPQGHMMDFSYYAIDSSTWGVVDIFSAIVVVNAPVLYTAFKDNYDASTASKESASGKSSSLTGGLRTGRPSFATSKGSKSKKGSEAGFEDVTYDDFALGDHV